MNLLFKSNNLSLIVFRLLFEQRSDVEESNLALNIHRTALFCITCSLFKFVSLIYTWYYVLLSIYVVCGVMIVNYIKTEEQERRKRKQSDIIKKQRKKRQNSDHPDSVY